MDAYTAMCDTPEIQGERPRILKGDLFIVRGTSDELCGEPAYPSLRKNYLWKPRQEDIQEMWKRDHPDHKDGLPCNWVTLFIDDFYEWAMACEYDKSLLYGPMISLQLAFYMQEIHNKRWTEKGWV